jgi:hypothetical protein
MQIKFKAASLNDALSVVSVVDPRAVSGQATSSVYLFHCFHNKEREDKPWCHIYSRNLEQVARAGFELEEMDEEGQFTYQVQPIQIWRNFPEDIVTIKSVAGQDESQPPSILVHSTSDNKYDHSTFDPRRVDRCDKKFDEAKASGPIDFNVGVLRAALTLAQAFLPGTARKGVVEDHFNTVQTFDKSKEDWARGNGHLFCSDGHRVFYFQSAAFEDKLIAVHASHIAKVTSFLNKCSGVAKFYRGTTMTFAVSEDKDQFFGWANATKEHSRFATYPLALDKWVLHIPKSSLIKAIDTASLVIDVKQDQRVHVVYSHADEHIRLVSSESAGKFESFPVYAGDKADPKLDKDFDFEVDLAAFRSIVQDVKDNEVQMRFAPMEDRKGAFVRTIESVRYDSNGKVFMALSKSEDGDSGVLYPCNVTRIMTSMA